MRQLVRVVLELADEPDLESTYFATHAHALKRKQLGQRHGKSGIELEPDLSGERG
jgi:hypothetical protein